MPNIYPPPTFPMYLRGLLLLAGIYTIAWSALFQWFGEDLFRWLSMNNSAPIGLESGNFGLIGLVGGVMIFFSAFYPVSWIYLILAGIIAKILTAGWFSLIFLEILGWSKRTVFHLVFNELLWIVPLILIFLRAITVKAYLKTLPDWGQSGREVFTLAI
jgi:hypothetical protein